jgi:hypothetical protein
LLQNCFAGWEPDFPICGGVGLGTSAEYDIEVGCFVVFRAKCGSQSRAVWLGLFPAECQFRHAAGVGLVPRASAECGGKPAWTIPFKNRLAALCGASADGWKLQENQS